MRSNSSVTHRNSSNVTDNRFFIPKPQPKEKEIHSL
jgi:hypothetical protein